MFFAIFIPLATFIFVGAVPLVNEDATLETASLVPRNKNTSGCGLDMYEKMEQAQVRKGLWDLTQGRDDDNDGNYYSQIGMSIVAIPGDCKMFTCRGHTGFSICIDDPEATMVTYEPQKIGQELLDTYNDCYGGDPSKGHEMINAYQFWAPGYNLLVKGGHDCEAFWNSI